MFTISGVYGIKLYPNGSVSRLKRAFAITLNTEKGVMEFLDEQKPFSEVKIVDSITKEDKTEYFLGPEV
jgi:hypothetical protein